MYSQRSSFPNYGKEKGSLKDEIKQIIQSTLCTDQACFQKLLEEVAQKCNVHLEKMSENSKNLRSQITTTDTSLSKAGDRIEKIKENKRAKRSYSYMFTEITKKIEQEKESICNALYTLTNKSLETRIESNIKQISCTQQNKIETKKRSSSLKLCEICRSYKYPSYELLSAISKHIVKPIAINESVSKMLDNICKHLEF